MEKPSLTKDSLSFLAGFLVNVGVTEKIPPEFDSKGFCSDFFRSIIKINRIERGRISSSLSVKACLANKYGGLHGGSFASVAETMATDCARTVLGDDDDKDVFLGELSISYLSAAPIDSDLIVEASVVKSGRNLTVILVEFKLKNSGKLSCLSRATFYNMPLAKL
ncbi:acyl-coenzyme A thioesterase 13-like [Impatiens glandulifera]|uniref:acyl-coenzyme A thioesterase 13-like n=1 Tax=Impatiens glandulifera TaxID=253017 RepID=UPI001FB09D9A|nr:acyl-coenzyme A thioesterase 13-like [Impatiens glandulifera]XP_047318166.1 acyl-coenzyme A thioesterase 13-like [Impatiens glandulifera]XP_047318167.1 acyl-coenzyme A thioesterase 13-like [Impatiens glandulifera]